MDFVLGKIWCRDIGLYPTVGIRKSLWGDLNPRTPARLGEINDDCEEEPSSLRGNAYHNRILLSSSVNYHQPCIFSLKIYYHNKNKLTLLTVPFFDVISHDRGYSLPSGFPAGCLVYPH